MKKYFCTVCYERFRHYYLYIEHLKEFSKKEIKLIKELKKKEVSPHLILYRRILDKCDKKIESMRNNI